MELSNETMESSAELPPGLESMATMLPDQNSQTPSELWTDSVTWINEIVYATSNGSQALLVDNMTTESGPTAISLTYSLPAMVTIAVVLFTVTVGTAFGNLLVGIALFKFKYLRTVSNYLIGSLALSDFLIAVSILPMSSVNECLGYWVFGEFLCTFWLSVDVLCCTASIWNLCIIALDRFTATLYPVWYREKRSLKQAVLYIAFVWVFSVAISVPPLIGWKGAASNFVFDNETQTYRCRLFDEQSYVVYSASGSFFIPLLITTFLYIRIFMVLRVRMRRMRSSRLMHHKKPPTTQNKTAMSAMNHIRARLMGKKSETIEMNNINHQQDKAADVEDAGRKSPFSSATDSGEDNKSDEDSATHLKSSNPTFMSSSDPETAVTQPMVKNGLTNKCAGEDTLVILNPVHCYSDSERDGDPDEKIHILVTEDDEETTKDSDTSETLKEINKGKSVTIEGETKTKDKKDLKKTTKSITDTIKSSNPFKFQRKTKHRTSEKKRYDQREVRATIRMAIIIACFCGCWLGFFVCYVVSSLCRYCHIPHDVGAFFFWLGYSNSSLNPILYTIFNEEFRRAFQKLLGCYNHRPPGIDFRSSKAHSALTQQYSTQLSRGTRS